MGVLPGCVILIRRIWPTENEYYQNLLGDRVRMH
jgi:hypothetical protein